MEQQHPACTIIWPGVKIPFLLYVCWFLVCVVWRGAVAVYGIHLFNATSLRHGFLRFSMPGTHWPREHWCHQRIRGAESFGTNLYLPRNLWGIRLSLVVWDSKGIELSNPLRPMVIVPATFIYKFRAAVLNNKQLASPITNGNMIFQIFRLEIWPKTPAFCLVFQHQG